MYESIPQELKKTPQWICWKLAPDRDGAKKPRKIPVNTCGGMAAVNDPNTWTNFDLAAEAAGKCGIQGIGYVFAASDDFFGVDLDDCEADIKKYLEGDRGNIISDFVDGLKSYTELSQSGKGIHIICRGVLPGSVCRKGNVEMYEKGRYFITTGVLVGDYKQIAYCTELIKPLYEKYIGCGSKAPEKAFKSAPYAARQPPGDGIAVHD
jgi:putative DNA primase/helicase